MMTPPLGIRLAASSAAYITLTFARRVSRALASSALEPMYATIGSDVPTGPGWTFEPKYDGMRALAFVTPTRVRLVTSNRQDKARKFTEVVDALRALACRINRS